MLRDRNRIPAGRLSQKANEILLPCKSCSKRISWLSNQCPTCGTKAPFHFGSVQAHGRFFYLVTAIMVVALFLLSGYIAVFFGIVMGILIFLLVGLLLFIVQWLLKPLIVKQSISAFICKKVQSGANEEQMQVWERYAEALLEDHLETK